MGITEASRCMSQSQWVSQSHQGAGANRSGYHRAIRAQEPIAVGITEPSRCMSQSQWVSQSHQGAGANSSGYHRAIKVQEPIAVDTTEPSNAWGSGAETGSQRRGTWPGLEVAVPVTRYAERTGRSSHAASEEAAEATPEHCKAAEPPNERA